MGHIITIFRQKDSRVMSSATGWCRCCGRISPNLVQSPLFVFIQIVPIKSPFEDFPECFKDMKIVGCPNCPNAFMSEHLININKTANSKL